MPTWRKICCAVDFSETSRSAMTEAAALARASGGRLTLLHVIELPAIPGSELVAPMELVETIAFEAEQKLESWRRDAEAEAGTTVEARALPGEAAAEIARFAQEKATDLVVIGTHGRKGIRHMVLGSVAEKVVRNAHCSVLVVRSAK